MQKAWKAAGVADDLPVDAASRARRLAEQGNERDWWRGGVEAGDGGDYTRFPAEAAGHGAATCANMPWASARHARVLDTGIVRDANRAAFDPRLKGKPGLFGALAPVGIGTGLLGYDGSSFSLGERPIW